MNQASPYTRGLKILRMKTPVEFRRRLGPDPHANGAKTAALDGCPDIFELASGDFAIIGIDITESSVKHLPPKRRRWPRRTHRAYSPKDAGSREG
jgi:hypothetical protein